mmetsp:Transcript_83/g.172  ORF Transcript_83/g.172 Transcript_83/m.172 type:complete len:573 (+) Transcript_83:56-1774(+)
MLEPWAGGLTASILVILSGLFSGLTLAWMSTDRDRLEILANGGTPEQRRFAELVTPLRVGQANLLLCSLLLANATVNAGLAGVLMDVTSIWIGFAITAALVTIFGELIPQLFVSRHALYVSAHTVWLAKILILLTGIVTWPLSKLIDFFVGAEISHYMTRDELRELLALHRGKGVEKNAAKIMSGALDLSGKQVKEIMTPISDVYRLEVNQKLDSTLLLDVFNKGYSRIPCYDAKRKSDQTIGLLMVKDLILVDPKDSIPLNTLLKLYGRAPVRVFPDETLNKMLDMFKSGSTHMAIVHDVNNEGDGDPFYEEIGLLTLEDIIESILQDNIVDETDVYIDVHKKEKVSGRKERDVSALQRLNRRQLPETILTPQELSAVYFHLRGNVDIFKPETCQLSPGALRKMLALGEVVQVLVESKTRDPAMEKSVSRAPGTNFVDISRGGQYLYVKDRPTEHMSVVLEGRIKVTAGLDGFVIEQGKWAVFCPGVFNGLEWDDEKEDRIREPAAFKPDFSARVTTNARVLRISRKKFIEAMKESKTKISIEGSIGEFKAGDEKLLNVPQSPSSADVKSI